MGNILKKIVKTSLELNILEIQIITISNNQKLQEQKLKISVLPFYEWALS